MIANLLDLYADRTLFHNDDGRSFFYADILELAEMPFIRMTSRRLVFCVCENKPGGLLGYLALLRADAVPLMLGSGLSELKLKQLISVYQPGFIWLPDTHAQKITDARPLYSYLEYTLFEVNEEQQYPIHNSLALLLSTSGSTGSPKFVRLSHENLLSNAQSIIQYLKITSDELPITTLPPSYTYGLSIIHSHILQGSSIALTNQTFFDRGFWGFLKSVQATSIAGVPYHYQILKKLRFSRMAPSSLRTITQAGGRMEPELTREFAALCAKRHIRFFTMYGQAEATARMSYLPAKKAVEKAGSIGGPITGGKFWLEDKNGQIQEGVDAIGQLVYQGNNVAMGYAQGYQDLARGDGFRGVLRTGDLARRDADGDYYIIGRLKRFLKLFGNRVNLQDIEENLLSEGYAAACAGRDDQLEIYLVRESREAAKKIKKQLIAQLNVTPKAIWIHDIAELPRNDSGKIQYSELNSFAKEILA